MSFPAKMIAGAALVIAVAIAAIFLLRSSEEQVIEELLEQGLEAAARGDADAVMALISPNYRNGEQTREQIERRIRDAVARRITPARLDGAAIQVSGDDAQANVQIEIGALQYRQLLGLSLVLKKEAGVWKVTSAEETR